MKLSNKKAQELTPAPVGVYMLETDTKLELDLNIYKGTPDEYKYKEALPSIKELEEKKVMLEKGNS